MRPSKRALDEMRPVSFERGVARYAEGSCLVKFGGTHVLCAASLEDKPPPWLRGQGRGWVTAEYAMLPRATHTRTRRKSTAGKPSGRTQEIQRLIGRGCGRLPTYPCRRTASHDRLRRDSGRWRDTHRRDYRPWLALRDCFEWMRARSIIKENPLRDHVAAVSCGIFNGKPVLDLDYAEDSTAQTDANFVITGSGGLVEIQATAEVAVFSPQELQSLLAS